MGKVGLLLGVMLSVVVVLLVVVVVGLVGLAVDGVVGRKEGILSVGFVVGLLGWVVDGVVCSTVVDVVGVVGWVVRRVVLSVVIFTVDVSVVNLSSNSKSRVVDGVVGALEGTVIRGIECSSSASHSSSLSKSPEPLPS